LGTAIALCAIAWSGAAPAAVYRNAAPHHIHADNNRPCVLFYLTGVTPDVGDVFAIPRSHPQFQELFAMLLTAKATGAKLGVFTTGGTACGQAEVNMIIIEE
jgi:hypothetical protein